MISQALLTILAGCWLSYLDLQHITVSGTRLIHILLSSLIILCFLRSMWSNPGVVPRSPESRPAFRMCKICEAPKPIRAYHCRRCAKCVFRMDHHCIWVNNCVGYGNQKYFILFLMYTIFLSIFSSVIQTWRLYRWVSLQDRGVSITSSDIFLFLLNAFVLLVVRGYFTDQLEAIESNTTLIETYKDVKGDDEVDVFRQIFGRNPFFWFLPINTLTTPDYTATTSSSSSNLPQKHRAS
jgi:palmitoyltransferase ZDHHC3/7/25